MLLDPTAPIDTQGGFCCDICKATFSSYDAYLDHCNSRLHLRNAGTNLPTERVDDVARIRARLAWLKQKKVAKGELKQTASQDPKTFFEDRLQKKEDQHSAERRKRYDKKKGRSPAS